MAMLDLGKRERWRSVEGYGDFYSVSSFGRVRSNGRWVKNRVVQGNICSMPVRARILKPGTSNGGYLVVRLCKDGKSRIRYVHQLVLEAFVGLCPEGKEVCHENDNPTDNRLENLRWDTRKSNLTDALRNGKLVTKLSIRDVRKIRRMRQRGIMLQEIAGMFGVSLTTISNVVNYKSWVSV